MWNGHHSRAWAFGTDFQSLNPHSQILVSVRTSGVTTVPWGSDLQTSCLGSYGHIARGWRSCHSAGLTVFLVANSLLSSLREAATSGTKAGPLSPGAGLGAAVQQECTRVGTRSGDQVGRARQAEPRSRSVDPGWAGERPHPGAAPSKCDNGQLILKLRMANLGKTLPQEAPPATLSQHRLQTMATFSQNWQINWKPRASPLPRLFRLFFWLSGIM